VEARQLIAALEAEAAVRDRLDEVLARDDVVEMAAHFATLPASGSPEFEGWHPSAQALVLEKQGILTRRENEERAKARLSAAIEARDMKALMDAIADCELACPHQDLAEAKQLVRDLQVSAGENAVASVLQDAHASAMLKFQQEQHEHRDQILRAMEEAREERDNHRLLSLIKEAAFKGLFDNEETRDTVEEAKQLVHHIDALHAAEAEVGRCLELVESNPFGEDIELTVCHEAQADALGLESAEVESLRSQADVATRRQELRSRMRTAMEEANLAALEEMRAEGEDLGLSPDFAAEVDAQLEVLHQQQAVLSDLSACQSDTDRSLDFACLEALLDRARHLGVVDDRVRWADHRVQQIANLNRVKKCTEEAERLMKRDKGLHPHQVTRIRAELDLCYHVEGVRDFEASIKAEVLLKALAERIDACATGEALHFSHFGRIRTFEDFCGHTEREQLTYLTVDDLLMRSFSKADGGGRAAPRGAAGLDDLGDRRHLDSESWPLHNSLTVLPTSALVAAAKVCSRDILGYCGDIRMMYPSVLAVDLVNRGWSDETGLLADEILVQLCRHLSGNVNDHSLFRGWTLLALCLRHFRPSPDFEPYMRQFLLTESKAQDPTGAGPGEGAGGGAGTPGAATAHGNVSSPLAERCLQEMNNLLELESNAPTMMDPDDFADFERSDEMAEFARVAHRDALAHRKHLVKTVSDSLEAMERVGMSSQFPMELKHVIEMTTRFGVDAAWEKLQTVQRQMNAHKSLELCSEIAAAHIVSHTGIDEASAADLSQELDLARENGVSTDAQSHASETLAVARAQCASIRELRSAVETRDPDTLDIAVSKARRVPKLRKEECIRQLDLYKQAYRLSQDIAPSISDRLGKTMDELGKTMGAKIETVGEAVDDLANQFKRFMFG